MGMKNRMNRKKDKLFMRWDDGWDCGCKRCYLNNRWANMVR